MKTDLKNLNLGANRILTEVAQLGAPNSFGDLALIDYKPRAATIKGIDDCIFACLDKHNYQKVFGKLQRRTFERTVELFRSIPYFTFWTPNDIKKFEQYFSEIKYRWNNTVFKQNEPSDNVYIIKGGEFEITKKRTETKDLSRGLLRCTSPVAGVNVLKNRIEARDIKLAHIGKGNMIGELDAVHKRNYSTSVRCISTTGVLLCIKAVDFIAIIKQTDKKTMKSIK